MLLQCFVCIINTAHKHCCSELEISEFEMKWNEIKYILFNKIYINLQQFQVIPENKTQGNLINYLIFMIKKMIKIKKAKLWGNVLDG